MDASSTTNAHRTKKRTRQNDDGNSSSCSTAFSIDEDRGFFREAETPAWEMMLWGTGGVSLSAVMLQFLGRNYRLLAGIYGRLMRGAKHSLRYLAMGCKRISSLPRSMRRMTNFWNVYLQYLRNKDRDHPLLPPWQFQNVKVLDLSTRMGPNLSKLPEEMGTLSSLSKLSLNGLEITSLPPSIADLKNLTFLDLSKTLLTTLPNEIGDLTNLKVLNLSSSNITSLPPSIGKLKHLEGLYLYRTFQLTALPQEIGNLVGLKSLILIQSVVRELPPSIGRLQSLEKLDIGYTYNLLELPEEIGNLTRLKIFELQFSHASSLPDSIVEFSDLLVLNLQGSANLKLHGKNLDAYLLNLAQRCRVLGFLGLNLEKGRGEVSHTLARNRARFRTGFGTTKEMSLQNTPKLWPLLLSKAARAFDVYRFISLFKQNKRKYSHRMPEPDAIYQLLVDNMESLLGVLVNRDGRRNIPLDE